MNESTDESNVLFSGLGSSEREEAPSSPRSSAWDVNAAPMAAKDDIPNANKIAAFFLCDLFVIIPLLHNDVCQATLRHRNKTSFVLSKRTMFSKPQYMICKDCSHYAKKLTFL